MSISVIAVLIAILAPALSGVREKARQVQCGSNLRQVGYALTMYAQNNRDRLPPSVYSRPQDFMGARNDRDPIPTEMMVVHLGNGDPNAWDGLGILFAAEYLNSPLTFYCPSHNGFHPIDRYEDQWVNLGAEIVGNYNYRTDNMRPAGSIANVGKTADDSRGSAATVALISDGLRTQPDYSHRLGNNVLRLDISVGWYNDNAGFISGLLPSNDAGRFRQPGLFAAWRAFDVGVPPSPGSVDDSGLDINGMMLLPNGGRSSDGFRAR